MNQASANQNPHEEKSDPRTRQSEAIEGLAKAIQYANPKPGRLFVRSLLIGLGTGLGATVGVTILVTVMGYVLSFLGYFAPLHSLVDTMQHTIKSTAPGKK